MRFIIILSAVSFYIIMTRQSYPTKVIIEKLAKDVITKTSPDSDDDSKVRAAMLDSEERRTSVGGRSKIEDQLLNMTLREVAEKYYKNITSIESISREGWLCLNALEKIRNQNHIPNKATIEEILFKSQVAIKIPYSNKIFNIDFSLTIICMVIIFLFLYLYSLMKALQNNLCLNRDNLILDWLFFHPGYIGPTLGIVWLLLPTICQSIGFFYIKNNDLLLSYHIEWELGPVAVSCSLLFFFSLLVINAAFSLRKDYLILTKTEKK